MYFRHSTRLEAERLGLRGVVRNLPDGSVEVIAHGTPEAVQSLRQWLDHGPSGARVAAVQEFELPAEPSSSRQPFPGRADDHQDGRSRRPFKVE